MPDTVTHLFLNPTAGRGRAGKRQSRIESILRDGNVEVETHLTASMGDLESQARELAESGASRIVVAGGDGSVHEAANGLLASGRDVALGVIPTGTGNDFAKACDIPLDWEHATELLADRIVSERTPRRIDVGRFNERYFVNGVGIGFDAKVTRIARGIRWPIGDLVYLVAVFRGMLDGVTMPRMNIDAGEFQWQDAMTLVNLSNGPWVGGMFHIAPMADNADGQLEMVMAMPMSRPRMLTLLPKLISGKHLDADDILHRRVTKFHAVSDRPLPSHLDGEVQPLQSEFDVELLPDALRVL